MKPLISIVSPKANWFSKIIDTPAIKSFKTSWKAKARAADAIPSPASTLEISIPNTGNIESPVIITTVYLTIFTNRFLNVSILL